MLVFDLEFGGLRLYRDSVAQRRIQTGRAQALDGSKLRHPKTSHLVRAGAVPPPEFSDAEEEEKRQEEPQTAAPAPKPAAQSKAPRKKRTPRTRQRYKTRVMTAEQGDAGLLSPTDDRVSQVEDGDEQ